MSDVKELARAVVQETQDYVARAVEPVRRDLAALEQRLAALPTPKDGKDGTDADVGEFVSELCKRFDDVSPAA